MLATSPYMSSAHHAFLPTTPSPLSPRSANIHGRPHAGPFFMDEKQRTDDATSAAPTTTAKDIPFAKRPVKKAPSPKQDELKERRRNMFLRKVKDGREDRRFETRGEDIMRLDFVQRQKSWEAQLAREAPEVIEEEEEYGLPTSSSAMQISAPPSQHYQPQQYGERVGAEEVDEVLQREDQELEALISYLPPDDSAMMGEDRRSEHLYSDDDDYDALFSEFMEQDAMLVSSGQPKQQTGPPPSQDNEAMDMS